MTAEEQIGSRPRSHSLLETLGTILERTPMGNSQEDYSPDGAAYFPHDHARSRASLGEDGIAGISDNHQRLCFAVALWNGSDPILKENVWFNGEVKAIMEEDVKEYYFYIDNTPTFIHEMSLQISTSCFPYTH